MASARQLAELSCQNFNFK